MRVEWTHESRSDIDRFIDFLIEKNPLAAIDVVDAIEQGAEHLILSPKSGIPLPDRSDHREWPIKFGKKGYVLRYYPDFTRDELWIIRVWAGPEDR